MSAFFSYTIIGIFTGAAYAIAASGLVLTYSTTRVFNIAHGALGMFFAYVYWDFSQKQGMPVPLALFVVLVLVAPAFGFLLQRFVVRDLGTAPVGLSLVVTVALLVAMFGIVQTVWPSEGRSVPQFFEGHLIRIGDDIVITWHQLITVILSGVVALALFFLLARTRIGTAMRASVDNPDLLRLYGGRPQLVAGLAWAIGASLAALAGILLTPVIGMQAYDLTLLVISAYAAAMLGKLTSLPLTFVGAMGLGIGQAYVIGYLEYIPFADKLGGLPAVMPTLFLFAILVLLPQAPLRIGQVKGIVSAPVPSFAKSGVWGGVMVLIVALLVLSRSESDQLLIGKALALGIVMLSLVLLNGYGGFVSLAQFTFAGVGAVAYSRLDEPNLLGLVLAGVIAALVGALVAIPVLRLTGLYLALATMAFALLMDKLVFDSEIAYEIGNPLYADRLSLFGINFDGTAEYVVLMSVFFVAIGLIVIAVRRGRIGRMLIAMRDSQAACGTLGLDLRWMRVGLFASSAGVAGVGGALFAGLFQTTVAAQFIFFESLTLLLMAVVWGLTSVTGAALGGVFMMLLPEAQSSSEAVAGLLFVGLAVSAIVVARVEPNGLANVMFKIPRLIQVYLYPYLADRFPGMALRLSPDNEEEIGDDQGGEIDDTSVIPAVREGEEADDVVAAR